MLALFKKLSQQEDGVILTETLVALPILILISITFVEFGNIMWQRQQLQAGVEDAARYWSRCRPLTGSQEDFMSCNVDTARLIAFTGSPEEGGASRVPGWGDIGDISELKISPEVPETRPTKDSLVLVSGTVTYRATPWTARFVPDGITMSYYHQMRYLGW
jgi:hypothetical protein